MILYLHPKFCDPLLLHYIFCEQFIYFLLIHGVQLGFILTHTHTYILQLWDFVCLEITVCDTVLGFWSLGVFLGKYELTLLLYIFWLLHIFWGFCCETRIKQPNELQINFEHRLQIYLFIINSQFAVRVLFIYYFYFGALFGQKITVCDTAGFQVSGCLFFGKFMNCHLFQHMHSQICKCCDL